MQVNCEEPSNEISKDKIIIEDSSSSESEDQYVETLSLFDTDPSFQGTLEENNTDISIYYSYQTKLRESFNDILNIEDDESLIPDEKIHKFYLSRDYTKQNYCKFIVDYPIKSNGILKSKVTYRITCHTRSTHFEKKKYTIRRSFADIKWLKSFLEWIYPHCIIPPLKNTKTLSQRETNSILVNVRRRSIQRFLNRVGSHPLLALSKLLKLFISQNDNFKSLKKKLNEKRKRKSKHISYKYSGISLFSPNISPISSNDEKLLEKIKIYKKEVYEMENSFRTLQKSAHDLVNCRKSSASSLKSFSKNLNTFGNVEPLRRPLSRVNSDILIDLLISFQKSFEWMKIEEMNIMEFESDGLHEIIKDWTSYMKEAAKFMNRYEKWRILYNETTNSIESTKKKINSKESKNGKNDQENNMQELLKSLAKQLDKEKMQLDLFIKNFDKEREFFDKLKTKEILQWTKYYASFHLKYHKSMISKWESYMCTMEEKMKSLKL